MALSSRFLCWKGTLEDTLLCFVHYKGTPEDTLSCFIYHRGIQKRTFEEFLSDMGANASPQLLPGAISACNIMTWIASQTLLLPILIHQIKSIDKQMNIKMF